MQRILVWSLALALLIALIPFSVSAAPLAQEVTCEEEYTVQADDWLSKLADKYWGNIMAYPAIVEATNQKNAEDDTFAKIDNPDLIEIGWKICIPSANVAQELLGEAEVAVEPQEVAGKTLVFSSRLFSPPREQEFVINEIIKPFEEEHGVKVNFQILDDDALLERAKVQQETGNVTTDIVCAHNGKMPDWLDAGYVEDLTDVVAGWTDRNFMQTFSQDTNRDGRQYFLPVGADVYLLLANNKALPYLPEGADVNNLTWEQYADWAVNIAEGEGEGKVCITGIPMKSWIYMFGGTALSYGAGFPDINSAEAAQAWDIWTKIGAANGFVPTVLNIDSCVDPMMREESWLTVFHNARAGQVYASNETQYTLAPAPAGPNGIGTIAGVSGYAIMKGAPNYDLAVMFLEYLTRPDIQVKISKGTGGFIPPVQEAIDYMEDEAIDEVMSKAIVVLEKGVVSGVPAYKYQDWGAVKEVFDDVFKAMVLEGDGTVDQALLDESAGRLDALKKEEVAEPEPAAEDVAGKTLVFSSRLFSPPREQEFVINEIIKPFEEEHGVTVNFQILDDDALLERAKVQQETGNVTTDIVCAHNGKMPDWLDAGYVEDLTDVVAGWTDRNFMQTFSQDTNRDGRQYFLPVGADVYLLLANNKALPYLPEGADVNNLTWEQYADWAVNIAEGEGEGKVCITGIPMKSWIYMFGGTALSYGAGFPDINSAEAAQAWDIWTKIGAANGFVPTVLNIDSCVDPMMREESWLTVFHNARAGQVYASNETQYTLAPAPAGPNGIGTIAGVSGYAIMKGAPNYDLAVMFLEYLTRPDIQVKISKGTGGFIPPVQEAIDYMEDEAIDEVMSKAIVVLEKGVVSGVPAYKYQDWGAVKEVFDDVFKAMVLEGDGTVDQALLDESAGRLDALLK